MRSYISFNRSLARRYEEWMKAMHYTKMTQRIYQKVVWQYVGFFGRRSIASATHSDIRHYIGRSSEDGATLATVYRSLGVLRQFYDFLHLGGVVDYVAPRFVRLRRPPRNNLRTLTQTQVEQVMSATQTPRERALIEFFYGTGCRLSETRLLKIQDIDFPHRSARIQGKFGRTRTAFLTVTVADALRAYIGSRRKGYVFLPEHPSQRGCLSEQEGKWYSKWRRYVGPKERMVQTCKFHGRVDTMSYEVAKKKHDLFIASLKLTPRPRNSPLSKVAVQTAIRRIAYRAHMKFVTPHTFRRTFATHMYERGATVEIIKALMGHAWISTTMRYARIGPDKLARTIDRYHPRGTLNGKESDQGS
jgi:site-specific recombinase XerD